MRIRILNPVNFNAFTGHGNMCMNELTNKIGIGVENPLHRGSSMSVHVILNL